MPKVISSSSHKHPAFSNIGIFAQPVKGDGQANWYAQITFSRNERIVRSLKIPYIPNDERNKDEADKAAIQVYYELDKRRQQGLTNKRQSLLKLIDRFLKEQKQQTEENIEYVERGMNPPHIVAGGKSPLDKGKMAHINHTMRNLC